MEQREVQDGINQVIKTEVGASGTRDVIDCRLWIDEFSLDMQGWGCLFKDIKRTSR